MFFFFTYFCFINDVTLVSLETKIAKSDNFNCFLNRYHTNLVFKPPMIAGSSASHCLTKCCCTIM